MGTWGHESRFSNASGMDGLPYVVLKKMEMSATRSV